MSTPKDSKPDNQFWEQHRRLSAREYQEQTFGPNINRPPNMLELDAEAVELINSFYEDVTDERIVWKLAMHITRLYVSQVKGIESERFKK